MQLDMTKRSAIKIRITHVLHVYYKQAYIKSNTFPVRKFLYVSLNVHEFGYFLYLCMESLPCQNEYLQFSMFDFFSLRLNIVVCYISLIV